MIDFYLFIFTSNADAVDFLVLGKSIEVWLIYTLIFFGLTSIAFMATWLSGLIFKQESEKPLD